MYHDIYALALIIYHTSFIFDSKTGGNAYVQCYDWSNEMKYVDHLRISISTKEVVNWTNNNYGMN